MAQYLCLPVDNYEINKKFTNNTFNNEIQTGAYDVPDGELGKYYYGNPKITFNRTIFLTYTNRKISYHSVQMDITPNFGGWITIKIPHTILYLDNLLLELNLKIFVNDVLSKYQIKWCNNLSVHLFEYVKIYYGNIFLTTIDGDANYLRNLLLESIEYNEFTNKITVFVPIGKNLVPIVNILGINNELTYHIKLREYKHLIKLYDNEIDITHMYDIDSNIDLKIIDANLTIRHYLCTSAENTRFLQPLEHRMRVYKSYIVDANKISQIKINDIFALAMFGIYIRNVDSLSPISNKNIKYVELVLDGNIYMKLNADILRKLHDNVLNCEYTRYMQCDNTDREIDTSCNLNRNINICSYILYYNLGSTIPNTSYQLSCIIDLSIYKHAYINVYFDDDFDFNDKQIVLVCFGEIIYETHIGSSIRTIPVSIDRNPHVL